MKRRIIPYNPVLKELAKKLRYNMTFSEVKLWNELKNGKMLGYDFDRQRPIGNYIVDFYCKDLKLALEVDGITHADEHIFLKDKVRQDELEMLGVSFLRFDALLIVNKVEAVLKVIENWIFNYESKNGLSEFVKRKRMQLKNPKTREKKNPPLPLPGGDATTQNFEKSLADSSPPGRGEIFENSIKTTGVG
ncbi:MAG: endonuclease domain-containing protein [Chitinophagales bacterium]